MLDVQGVPRERASRQGVAVEVRGLVRSYGRVPAVRGVDLVVHGGERVALLGPNGAGKSTVMNVLCTRLLPEGGTVRIAGLDPVQDPDGVRRRIGVVFQERTLDPQLTIVENLAWNAALQGLAGQARRAALSQALSGIGLTARRRHRASTLSPGTARRLELACALLARPDILFLDEPSLGLDPGARAGLWDDLTRRQQDGLTVLFTTHYLDEAESADRVAIMDEGRIIATGKPADLKLHHGLGAAATLDDVFLATTGRRIANADQEVKR